jgi:hypothetical protein
MPEKAAERPIPNFFIVGAPRCGTTAMAAYLGAHPEITMAKYKEPHYFGADLVGQRFEIFRNQPEKYHALFKDVGNARRAGEASIYYLFSKQAAQEIHAYNPDARIIIMLRSPIDLLYSMFNQTRFTGSVRYDSLEDAVFPDAPNPPPGQESAEQFLWDGAGVRFTEQVKRYLDVFGREQVHINIFDDLKADPARIYRETLDFLGVDPNFTTEFKIINPRKAARNPIVQKVLSNKWLIAIGSKIPGIALPIYRALKVLNSKEAKPEPINPQTRLRLQQKFTPEIEQLSNLLGRDLTHWCHDETPAKSTVS